MFKVPEKFRIKDGPFGSDESFGNNGAFSIEGLYVIASADALRPTQKRLRRLENSSKEELKR